MRLTIFALLLPGLLLPQTKAPAPAINKSVGSASAPVTVEVFSDYQCPACKKLHDDALKPMIVDYVHNGKVRVIFRDFPLPMHPYARIAAQYAVAAARINKYETVSEALWKSQPNWSQNGAVESAVAAALPPADFQKVKSMLNDPAVIANIEADTALAKDNRVQQTPTMYISKGMNRRYPVAGSVNYGVLKRFLDDLIAK